MERNGTEMEPNEKTKHAEKRTEKNTFDEHT